MTKFKKALCMLLFAASFLMILPHTPSSASSAATTNMVSRSDVEFRYTEGLFNGSEHILLEFVLYEGRYYLPMISIARLARFETKEYDSTSIRLEQGYRLINMEPDGDIYDTAFGTDKANVLIIGDEWYAEAVPMLRFLGADVDVDENGLLKISNDLVTIWDVLGDLRTFDPETIDLTLVYEDGQKAVMRKAWCDMALDLLDNANGEGLGAFSGAHLESALRDALEADISNYSFADREEKEYLERNEKKTEADPQILKKIADCVSKGKTTESDIEDLVELDLNLIEFYDFELIDQLREAFTGNDDFQHWNDLAHAINGGLSESFLKVKDNFDTATDYLKCIRVVTGVITGCMKDLSYTAETRQLLSAAIDKEFCDFVDNEYPCGSSWTIIARALGASLETTEAVFTAENLHAFVDFFEKKLVSDGAEWMLDQFVTGYGKLIKILVDAGWTAFSLVFKDQLEAVSDDLDAIYLSKFTRDICSYALHYADERQGPGLMDENALQHLRSLCILGWRCGLSFGENFSNSLAHLFDSKADYYASIYGDKTHVSVANNMARRFWRASNCTVKPVQSISAYEDDLTGKVKWYDNEDYAQETEIVPVPEQSGVVREQLRQKLTMVGLDGNVYAITENNELWCWGRGVYFGSSPNRIMNNAVELFRTEDPYSVLALDSAHTLWQVAVSFQTAPKAKEIMSNVRCVEYGNNEIFAICMDGSLWLLNQDSDGNIISGRYENELLDENVQSIVACGGMYFSLHNDGSLWACGSGECRYTCYGGYMEPGVEWSKEAAIAELAEERGRYPYFSLGDGTEEGSETLVRIADDVKHISCVPVKSIAANGTVEFGCTCYIIKEDGSLWGWGYNEDYNLGDGTAENRSEPVKILDDVAVIDAQSKIDKWETGNYAFALQKDGTLLSWGNNDSGILGFGNEIASTPTEIMKNVQSFKIASSYHAYALKFNGSLYGWGYGDETTPIGDGSTESRSMPVHIMDDVKNIDFCDYRVNHRDDGLKRSSITYVIKNDDSLWGWGYGGDRVTCSGDVDVTFILGNGKVKTQLFPARITDNAYSMMYAATSGWNAVLMKRDGSVWSWCFGITTYEKTGKTEITDLVRSPYRVFTNVKLP